MDAGGNLAVWLTRVDRRTSPAPIPQLAGADSIRNRCDEDQTYEARLAAGTLP